MTLIYLPASGLYINPVHILFVRKVGNGEYSIKFSGNQPNLIIVLEDLQILTGIVDEF